MSNLLFLTFLINFTGAMHVYFGSYLCCACTNEIRFYSVKCKPNVWPLIMNSWPFSKTIVILEKHIVCRTLKNIWGMGEIHRKKIHHVYYNVFIINYYYIMYFMFQHFITIRHQITIQLACHSIVKIVSISTFFHLIDSFFSRALVQSIDLISKIAVENFVSWGICEF